MDHAEVGCLLAEKWGLSDIFIDAIKNHHHPDKSDSHLPHMVFIADVLMTRFQAGLEIEKLNTGRLRNSMERVGLNMSQFPAIVDLVPHFNLGAEPGEDMD
jgi:HD superfamily phosphohydrolase YqeK